MIHSIISNGHSTLGQAVIYYGYNLLKEHGLSNKYCSIIDDRGNSPNPNKIIKTLPIPHKSIICYNGNRILVNTIEHGSPKEFPSHTGYFYSIELQILDNEEEHSNTKEIVDKYHEIMDSFQEDALIYYKKNILDFEDSDEKILIQYYDRCWILLNKRFKRHINSIFLKDNMELSVLEYIRSFMKDETREFYQNIGVHYKLNLLFEGYPGTGKTSLALSIASELNYDISIINFDNAMTDNEFIKAIRKLPKRSILLLEDIDVLFEARKQNDDYKSALTFSGLLNALDGPACKDGIIIILTTNYKCKLDKALIRPGRINKTINFGYADKNQTQKMFNAFYPKKKDIFDEFYEKIKSLDYTPAVLQQYFLNNLSFENIDEKELEKLCNDNTYNDRKINMYS